jgi:N-acetylmuramic acid 6-phosphate etherase
MNKPKHADLLTEQRNPASQDIDTKSVQDILTIINNEDRKIPEIIQNIIPDITHATNLVVDAMAQGGRLIYVGAGTSGRLGVLDASEIPPTYNAPPTLVQGFIAGGDVALRTAIEGAEDSPEDGAKLMDEINISSVDVLMGIASSGVTPFVLGALQRTHDLGGKTIFLTCVAPEHIQINVDVLISAQVGPEVVTGSTRMKAGTITKQILNMISTTAMIKAGKVYENLMVDLKATNNKLVDRGRRIISSITQTDYQTATALLEQADNYVKVAIIMHKTNSTVEEAKKFLNQYHGNVRLAMKKIEEK